MRSESGSPLGRNGAPRPGALARGRGFALRDQAGVARAPDRQVAHPAVDGPAARSIPRPRSLLVIVCEGSVILEGDSTRTFAFGRDRASPHAGRGRVLREEEVADVQVLQPEKRFEAIVAAL